MGTRAATAFERAGTRRLRVAWALAIVGLSACDAERREPAFISRDSAGIEIVESLRCSWGSAGPWSVDEAPVFRVGGDDVEGDDLIIRITHAMTLVDGRIAVADNGSGRIRIFGRDGQQLVRMGLGGEGPGQFRSIARLIERQGRLWAFDARRGLLTRFDDTGGFVESVAVGDSSAGAVIADVITLADGTLFGLERSAHIQAPVSAVVRDTVTIFRLDADAPRPVTTLPGWWTETLHTPSDVLSVGPLRRFGPLPLTPVPSWSTDGQRLFYTSGDRFEFVVADTTGRPLRIVRRTEAAPLTTDVDVERWWEIQLKSMDDASRAVHRRLGHTFPERLPVYGGMPAGLTSWEAAFPKKALMLDPDGNVWAHRFGDVSREWDVYDGAGACLGAVTMPEGLMVHEIGADYVLGGFTVNADLEYAQVHRLRK